MITIKTTIIMIVFKVGFNYKMELVSDNNYGALNLTTNKWNGLVRVFIILLLFACFSFYPRLVEKLTQSFP